LILIDKAWEFAFNNGLGVVFGTAAFVAWFYTFLGWIKDKRATEQRLVGIIKDRKTDRDKQLEMWGQVIAYMQRQDLVERVSRAALSDALRSDVPRRRSLDREIASAIRDAKQPRLEPEDEDARHPEDNLPP
jgi:hypothetical protein